VTPVSGLIRTAAVEAGAWAPVLPVAQSGYEIAEILGRVQAWEGWIAYRRWRIAGNLNASGCSVTRL